MEKAFYFENEGKRLFAILYSPRNSSGNKGIIFCHPYGEEKQLSYRVLVRFARELYDKGFYILRFDCRGYGDSQGDIEDATLETQITDTIKAIDLLKDRFGIEKISLLGLRLGGTIATLIAEQDSRIDKLILWSPIIKGKEYLEELIKKKLFLDVSSMAPTSKSQIIEELKSKGVVNIQGHHLTQELYKEFSGIDLTTHVSNFRGPVFISTIKDTPTHYRSFEVLSEIYRKKGVLCELKVIDEKVFWDVRPLYEWYFPEQLYKETLKWILGNSRES